MPALGRNLRNWHQWLMRQSQQRKGLSRRLVPNAEFLEAIALLSNGSPVISGFVFLDQSANSTLTNNGLFDTGENGLPTASVELFNATNQLVAATTTNASGFYQFTGPQFPAPPTHSVTQTITVPTTLTDFTQPFSPALQLFDTALGTLEDVKITTTVNLSSTIQAENTSTSSGASITAHLFNGHYQIDGLNTTIQNAAPLTITSGPVSVSTFDGTQDFLGPDSVTFPALSKSDSQSFTIASGSPALAFYESTSANTSITPTLTASAQANATSPIGNTDYRTTSSATATITITYDYLPTTTFSPGQYTIVQTPILPGYTNGKESRNGTVLPPPAAGNPQMIPLSLGTADAPNNDFGKLVSSPGVAPAIVNVLMFGVHMEQSEVVVYFNGPVDPSLIPAVENPKNYVIIGQNRKGAFNAPGQPIYTIAEAVYNAQNNTVTLLPEAHLNTHQRYEMGALLPGYPFPYATIIGGKLTLGGQTTAIQHATTHRAIRHK